jgi:hypothetical protein
MRCLAAALKAEHRCQRGRRTTNPPGLTLPTAAPPRCC